MNTYADVGHTSYENEYVRSEHDKGIEEYGAYAMYIDDILWFDSIIEKLEGKHHISPEEVEEVFYNEPRIRRAQKGHVQGEDLYYAYGQTDSGRYVFVVFVYKQTREALIVSARDMDRKERIYYGKA